MKTINHITIFGKFIRNGFSIQVMRVFKDEKSDLYIDHKYRFSRDTTLEELSDFYDQEFRKTITEVKTKHKHKIDMIISDSNNSNY